MRKTVALIGQAPPLRAAAVPYERTRLWRWLEGIGLVAQDVDWIYDSVLQDFPGRQGAGDRSPSRRQVSESTDRLTATVVAAEPDLVILIGLAAAQAMLPDATPGIGLDDLVGTCWKVEALPPLVVLPHPSGRSSWIYSSTDRMAALNQSLRLIKTVLGS